MSVNSEFQFRLQHQVRNPGFFQTSNRKLPPELPPAQLATFDYIRTPPQRELQPPGRRPLMMKIEIEMLQQIWQAPQMLLVYCCTAHPPCNHGHQLQVRCLRPVQPSPRLQLLVQAPPRLQLLVHHHSNALLTVAHRSATPYTLQPARS